MNKCSLCNKNIFFWQTSVNDFAKNNCHSKCFIKCIDVCLNESRRVEKEIENIKKLIIKIKKQNKENEKRRKRILEEIEYIPELKVKDESPRVVLNNEVKENE